MSGHATSPGNLGCAHPEHDPVVLQALLEACEEEERGIDFADFCRVALYHREAGYYRKVVGGPGREGDFLTSVSMGRCFGSLLARRIGEVWEEEGRPASWFLIEQGAHDGRLMRDVLTELEALHPKAKESMRVVLLEPSEMLAQRQEDTLRGLDWRIEWHRSGGDLRQARGRVHGLHFSNELVDALPFSRVRFRNGTWHRLRVRPTEGNRSNSPGSLNPTFEWIEGEAVATPEVFPEPFLDVLEDGYTTETFPGYEGFARDVASLFQRGRILVIDYGFAAEDFYHPQRREGCLRVYHRHQAIDDPFCAIGCCDISVHVQWDALRQHLEGQGFSCRPLVPQGTWLVRLAEPWLRAIENSGREPDGETRSLLRQFQNLTHPGAMGMRFQVLEATLDRG